MRIGIVTTWFERGAAYVSRAYMQALQPQHQVFIYARGGERSSKGDPTWDLPNVCYAPDIQSAWLKSADAIPRAHFHRWLRRNAIAAVLFNEVTDLALVRAIGRLGYVTGAYVDYYTQASASGFDAFDFLICNTRRHYSVFQGHRRCLYLPWGTDVSLFRPPDERPSLADGLVFFHSAGLGGVYLRKGTDLLVRAFQGVRGPARLVIHSQAALSAYAPVADLIANDPRIIFIERTVGAPGLYHLGHVYAYPSRLEGIGLSVPEALACGLPVITTDHAPMNEFVRDGVNGLLARVDHLRPRPDGYYWPESVVDLAHLTAQMQRYVDDPALAEQHGRQARQDALERLDWRRNAAGLAAWMDELPAVAHRAPSFPNLARWAAQDALHWALAGVTRLYRRLASPRLRQAVRRWRKLAHPPA